MKKKPRLKKDGTPWGKPPGRAPEPQPKNPWMSIGIAFRVLRRETMLAMRRDINALGSQEGQLRNFIHALDDIEALFGGLWEVA